MKSPPRLRLEPRPSRIGAVAVLVGTVATALLAWLTIDESLAGAVVVAAVGAVGSRAARTLSRPPFLVHVGVDRRVGVTARDGCTREGAVHTDTSVGDWLTTIVWVPDGARWWEPARTLLVLPDTLPADDFRRLRVYLRYGRAPPDSDTSGAVAP